METTDHLRFDFSRPRSRRERIARLDSLATLLDTAFVIPGTNIRFGLDALIGLVPGIGDAARMLANVALDGVVGAVPLVGDAFDVMWRSNRRNMRLLYDWLEREERP
jgi:hypothetical protein